MSCRQISMVACVALCMLSGLLPSQEAEARRGPDLPVELQGGSLSIETIKTTYDSVNPDASKPRIVQTDGLSVFLDFGLNLGGFAGDLRTNWIADAPESDFKFRYGDRIFEQGGDRAEVYSFSASRLSDGADFHLFYHVPRYHWGFEGDFFGLMYETTNMYDQDIWNEKAPSGLEIVGKETFDGLKVVVGQEVYWGAHPMVLAKYQFGENGRYSVLTESDITDQAERKRLSLQGSFDVSDSLILHAGLLWSGKEAVGNLYATEVGGVLTESKVKSDDALAVRLRLEQEVGTASVVYGEYNRAGLVAIRGEHQEVWETNIPYSSAGNKTTMEIGGRFIEGSWMLSPRIFVRHNEVEPLSIAARNAGEWRDGNADYGNGVHDNREVEAVELFLTFDPTPGTFFYEWDNYLKEDATFAFNFGLTKANYTGRTDMRVWDWGADWGRSPEKTERIFSRFVYNPIDSLKISGEIESGHQVPLFGGNRDPGDPLNTLDNKTRFTSVDTKFVYRQNNIFSLVYKNDAYGEYDWYANYGTSFPRQVMFGYERLLDDRANPSKIGFKLYKRDLNDQSGGDFAGGANRDMREAHVYYVYSF